MPSGADQARARYLKAATKDPRLMEAAAALVDNELPHAEARLRAHLAGHPDRRRGAAHAGGSGRAPAPLCGRADLLERCLELAPSFDAARHNYAVVLHRQGKAAAALPQVERCSRMNRATPATGI